MVIYSRIKNYFKRMHAEFPELTDSRRAVWAMYIDYILCFIKYGAVLDQYVRGGFYKLTSTQRKNSVTYRRITKVYNTCINPEYIHLLQNKVDFNNYFSRFIKRKWYFTKSMTRDDFNKLCTGVDYLIVKPTNESEGKGIYKIATPRTEIEFEDVYNSLMGGRLVVEECLKSHYSTTFGASSLNTLRVHSLLDKRGNVHFIKFIMRVGVGDTTVDNYCAGGCIYEVDEDSGKIIGSGYSKKYPVSDIHPGTDIVMPGRQIPYWDDVKKLVTEVHKTIPQMRFVGWDVAITENGPELIEGNHHPDYDLLEFVGTRFWWPKIKQYL